MIIIISENVKEVFETIINVEREKKSLTDSSPSDNQKILFLFSEFETAINNSYDANGLNQKILKTQLENLYLKKLNNPWYFFELVLMTRTPEGKKYLKNILK